MNFKTNLNFKIVGLSFLVSTIIVFIYFFADTLIEYKIANKEFDDKYLLSMKENVVKYENLIAADDSIISEDTFNAICSSLKEELKLSKINYFYFRTKENRICKVPENLLEKEISDSHDNFSKNVNFFIVPKGSHPRLYDYEVQVYSNFLPNYIMQFGRAKIEAISIVKNFSIFKSLKVRKFEIAFYSAILAFFIILCSYIKLRRK